MASIRELHRALNRGPVRVEGNRHASVAAVFTPSLRLLLMRRAQRSGDPWSGHVSLPGGAAEHDDVDHVATAMRETHEEVGLRLDRAQLVGPLDDLAAVGGKPGLVIRPFVFLVDREEPELSTNDDEVASTRWVDLRWLLSGEGRGRMRYQRHGYDLVLPEVSFPVEWGGVRLWGLTLRILDDLLDRLDGGGIGLDRIQGERLERGRI